MKKHKDFDCVQMKWDIQQKLAEEFAGLPDEEVNKVQMGIIGKNSILGPFLNKVRLLKKKETKIIMPVNA